MPSCPPTTDEPQRLRALRDYAVLDTLPEQSFDDLTLLASEICGTPISAVSLVDEERQWFKSIVGLEVTETPRDVAFCAHAILDPAHPLVVEDATQDSRFADNPLVTGEPHIRFYAGAPLVTPAGHALGTLCVIDRVPRRLTRRQRQALQVLGREVVANLELRRSVRQLEETVDQLDRARLAVERTRVEQLELKDRFISHVSHELRSPLTVIYQYLNILFEELAGPLTADQREYIEITLRNARQLRRMIGDLLELTRVTTGKLVIEPRLIEIDKIVQSVIKAAAVTAEARGVALSATETVDAVPVVADPSRVRQVLTNLVDNALKFTPSGGRIEVGQALEPGGQAVRVWVSDTGRGIPESDRDRVFEQLYQVPGAPEESRQGLGLGLAICKDLVRRQGGAIHVESTLGSGSTFTFTVPTARLASSIASRLDVESLARGRAALVAVAIGPNTNRCLGSIEAATLSEIVALVTACIDPIRDFVLPRAATSGEDEQVTVLALADQVGTRALVSRLRRQLDGADVLSRAGLRADVTATMLALPGVREGQNKDEVAEALARQLEGQLVAPRPGRAA